MSYMTSFERQGIEKGIKQTVEKVARNLLKLGLPIDIICKSTELQPEQVRSLAYFSYNL